MSKKTGTLMVTVLGVLAFTAFPARAHHGTAAYDYAKSTSVAGTVTKFDFSNPHAILELSVKDAKGKVAEWQAELTSPNHLMRVGWTKSTLKPGDMVTISGNPSKSGTNTLWIRKIAKAGGPPLPLAEEN